MIRITKQVRLNQWQTSGSGNFITNKNAFEVFLSSWFLIQITLGWTKHLSKHNFLLKTFLFLLLNFNTRTAAPSQMWSKVGQIKRWLIKKKRYVWAAETQNKISICEKIVIRGHIVCYGIFVWLTKIVFYLLFLIETSATTTLCDDHNFFVGYWLFEQIQLSIDNSEVSFR